MINWCISLLLLLIIFEEVIRKLTATRHQQMLKVMDSISFLITGDFISSITTFGLVNKFHVTPFSLCG